MRKKLFITCLCFLWFSSLLLAGYCIYEPKAADSVNTTNMNTVTLDPQTILVDSTLSDEVKEETDEEVVILKKYYYFCSPSNTDCSYVDEYVVKPLTVTLEVSQIPSIEFVNLDELSSDWTPARLKNQWGFDTFPAFVAVETMNEVDWKVTSLLQWDSNNPMNSEDLKKWMIENEIWTGEIEEKGELIDQPIE